MTPLSRLLERCVPRWLIAPALVLLYVAMMFATFVTSSNERPPIIYQDLRGH